MSDIVSATRSYLLTQSGVTALVGQRIYWDNLPQSATLPALVIELSSSDLADRTLAIVGTLFLSYVNVYCYASTHAAAASIGDAAHAALEFQSGTWGSVAVKRCYVENTQDVTDSPRDGSDAFRRVRALFCSMWHN